MESFDESISPRSSPPPKHGNEDEESDLEDDDDDDNTTVASKSTTTSVADDFIISQDQPAASLIPSVIFPDDDLDTQTSLLIDVPNISYDHEYQQLQHLDLTASDLLEFDTHLPISTKIREAIKLKINDVEWAKQIQRSYHDLQNKKYNIISMKSKILEGTSLGIEITERCSICTLPMGTCDHFKLLRKPYGKTIYIPNHQLWNGGTKKELQDIEDTLKFASGSSSPNSYNTNKTRRTSLGGEKKIYKGNGVITPWCLFCS